MDSDGDGFITPSEFKVGLRALAGVSGSTLSDAAVSAWMRFESNLRLRRVVGRLVATCRLKDYCILWMKTRMANWILKNSPKHFPSLIPPVPRQPNSPFPLPPASALPQGLFPSLSFLAATVLWFRLVLDWKLVLFSFLV